jgi:putative hydrolase of the HAD superfamily
MIRSLFFDLDGTLLDVTSAEARGARLLYETHGFASEISFEVFLDRWNELRTMYYDGEYRRGDLTFDGQRRDRIVALFDYFGRPIDERRASRIYSRYEEEFRANWRLYDDVLPTLDALAGHYTLGIITNGDEVHQREKLAVTGTSRYFSVVLASGSIHPAKPAPEAFLEAQRMSGSPLEALGFVGDSYETDVAPCAELGIWVAWLDRGSEYAPFEWGARIGSLHDLPRWLEVGSRRLPG